MGTVRNEIDAIDAQIEALKAQKLVLKNLPPESKESILNWTVRAVLADGTQTSWQIYTVRTEDYWFIVDTRRTLRMLGNNAFSWKDLIKYMTPVEYAQRSGTIGGDDQISDVEISGPFVATDWVKVS